MVKFIATTRDRAKSLIELDILQSKYSTKPMLTFADYQSIKSYCTEMTQWIVNSLDISFSYVNLIIRECQYVINSSILQHAALNDIQLFANYAKIYLTKSLGDKDLPSCKELLNHSEKDIAEKFQELIKDKKSRTFVLF